MFCAGIFLKIEDYNIRGGGLLYAGSSFIQVNTVVNRVSKVNSVHRSRRKIPEKLHLQFIT